MLNKVRRIGPCVVIKYKNMLTAAQTFAFFQAMKVNGGRGQVAISGRHMTCRRILSKMGQDGTKEKIKRLLRGIWDYQRNG